MRKLNQVKILAVETSCDDTCVAILKINPFDKLRVDAEQSRSIKNQKSPPRAGPPLAEKIKNGGFDVLSSIVSSQVKLHSKYGGIYPTLAKREHQRNLPSVLIQALKKAKLLKTQNSKLSARGGSAFGGKTQNNNLKLKTLENIFERERCLYKKTVQFLKKYQKPKINALAITVGPGLEPCLWVGINFAKSLAYFWDLPIVPTNHIEAHIFANFINTQINTNKNTNQHKKLFPAVCLVVSGGHTQLILMKDFGKYKIIGETRDDAAGECFDKTARILGLGYPGGPAIAEQARRWQSNIPDRLRLRANSLAGGQYPISNIQLPRPMINQKNYDFSFSGLKTAVLYKVKELKTLSHKLKAEFCAEIQQAIIDVLIYKTLKAAKDFKAKTIILGGGVTANDELRKQFASAISSQMPDAGFLVPPKNLCTDNAAMIGIVGYYHWLRKEAKNWEKIGADANLRLN